MTLKECQYLQMCLKKNEALFLQLHLQFESLISDFTERQKKFNSGDAIGREIIKELLLKFENPTQLGRDANIITFEDGLINKMNEETITQLTNAGLDIQISSYYPCSVAVRMTNKSIHNADLECSSKEPMMEGSPILSDEKIDSLLQTGEKNWLLVHLHKYLSESTTKEKKVETEHKLALQFFKRLLSDWMSSLKNDFTPTHIPGMTIFLNEKKDLLIPEYGNMDNVLDELYYLCDSLGFTFYAHLGGMTTKISIKEKDYEKYIPMRYCTTTSSKYQPKTVFVPSLIGREAQEASKFYKIFITNLQAMRKIVFDSMKAEQKAKGKKQDNLLVTNAVSYIKTVLRNAQKATDLSIKMDDLILLTDLLSEVTEESIQVLEENLRRAGLQCTRKGVGNYPLPAFLQISIDKEYIPSNIVAMSIDGSHVGHTLDFDDAFIQEQLQYGKENWLLTILEYYFQFWSSPYGKNCSEEQVFSNLFDMLTTKWSRWASISPYLIPDEGLQGIPFQGENIHLGDKGKVYMRLMDTFDSLGFHLSLNRTDEGDILKIEEKYQEGQVNSPSKRQLVLVNGRKLPIDK